MFNIDKMVEGKIQPVVKSIEEKMIPRLEEMIKEQRKTNAILLQILSETKK